MYVVYLRERLAAATGYTAEEQQRSEMLWAQWVEWVAQPPVDYEEFRALTAGRLRVARSGFSSSEATAARAWFERAEADERG